MALAVWRSCFCRQLPPKMMTGIGGDVFALAGIEHGLGKDGDGRAFGGTPGKESGAGGAGNGFGAVDVAFSQVQTGTFRQSLDGPAQESPTGQCAQERIAGSCRPR